MYDTETANVEYARLQYSMHDLGPKRAITAGAQRHPIPRAMYTYMHERAAGITV